ncbi:MAG TPA: di-heme oxidoredictase family protein, partial [Polyangiaceae bacterium]
SHVDGLSYGQLLDFELTFVRSRTYYTEWFSYYVGSGKFQPKIQHPWATAAGSQSVTNVTTDEFGYAQHVPNLTPATLANFISGKVLFEADFGTHVGYNPPTTYDCPRGLAPGSKVATIVTPPPPSPLFTDGNAYTNLALSNVTRPGYTASACFNCHHLDGKGRPADENGMGNTLLKLFSVAGDATSSDADPIYGTVLDQKAPSGAAPEVVAQVTWQTVSGSFADGTPYELRKPVLALNGLRDGALGKDTHVSARIPRPVFGLGLLEAVPEETILGLADPDDVDGDGVSGRPNFVTDAASGKTVLGRFGWKAGTPSLREQAALAFDNDIGLTSPLYPTHRCGVNQSGCLSSVSDSTPELADGDLDHIQAYLRGLSLPPRRNYDDPEAIQGKSLFESIGCVKCHVENLITSSSYEVPELRNLDIQPFTDLLLHDMGPDLGDDARIEEGSASGHEWRTCPLWGNGTGTAVMYPATDAFDPNGHPPPGGVYLHDGRARSISEAILWHGGEALAARTAFSRLSASERAALLAFVAYPFADPVLVRHCAGPTGSP